MDKLKIRKLRRLNIATHRDLGFFFSTLIIVYCLSGIALNHINEWNPDFILHKKTIKIPHQHQRNNIGKTEIETYGKLVGESQYKIYDFPTKDQVKIYYNDASLHVNFTTKEGVYESVSRRPLFYHSNVIHRNSVKGWNWVSDIFAIMLIIINITGLFILRGKYGISGRGKWLMAAGTLPPLLVLLINELS